MAGYVDIHAHILPGVDDGPEDMPQAIEMLRAAADCGISTIAATPHLRPDFPGVDVHEIGDRCEAVRELAASEGVAIELVSGAEVSIAWAADASERELSLASFGQRGRDLLLETPTTRFVAIERFIARLQSAGYRVTLGHPERSRDFARDAGRLRELVEHGVLLQVNADGLLGRGGGRLRRVARRLVTDGLAHAIASDGHRDSGSRPVTRLAEAARELLPLVGDARAQWLTEAAPRAILGGRELPPAPPVIALPPKRTLLDRLQGAGG
jgi:protein-tyrosine phosphatase